LRLISIILTVFSLFFFCKILSKFSISLKIQFPILLAFIFNPLVFSIGNTFLPDTIILFFGTSSLYFMIECLSSFSFKYYILFVLFSLLGTLNRQTGILIPLSFSFVFIYSNSPYFKIILKGLFPLMLNGLALLIYQYLAKENSVLPGNYNMQLNKFTTLNGLKSINLSLIVCYFLTSITTLGLFLFPLVISNVKTHVNELIRSKTQLYFFISFLLLLFYKSFLTVWYMPFVGNMFYPIGTGPMILDGFNSDKLILTNYNINYGIRLIYIMIGFIGGISFYFAFKSIIINLINKKKELSNYVGVIFLLLFTIYLGMITLNYPNDRYLLFLIPFFFIAYLVSFDFKVNHKMFLSSFLFLIYFTISTTFDYFRIHEARWKGIQYLKSDLKIQNEKIDGGFEFNAFYLEGRNDYKGGENYRWVVDDEYIISAVNRKKNYSVDSEYPFTSINAFPFNRIYVLKRD